MHPNLRTHEGFEDLARFDEATFEKYIKNKLQECDKHINFIKKNLIDDNYGGRTLEFGSGNGKLLYRLESEGMLEQGFGFELSDSRNKFAKKLGKYLGSKKVTSIHRDFLSIDQQIAKFDLLIGVDIVAQLIPPVSEDAEANLFSTIKSVLANNGWLLLELQDFSDTIRMVQLCGGELRQWKEFHISDPWRYGLDTFSVQGRDVKWDKTFINRNTPSEQTSSTEILRAYAREEIGGLLKSIGLCDVRFYDYWQEPGDMGPGEYIVVARQGG
jgi:hypothetical protein